MPCERGPVWWAAAVARRRTTSGHSAPPSANAAIARTRSQEPAAEPIPLPDKSILAAALRSGRFVTGVSLPPARGFGAASTAAASRRLALAGVTFVGLHEGSAARANVPPVALAASCRDAGVVPLVHYSARGRRLQRIQSDLLGAAVLGVEDVMLVTGDPLTPGAEQDAWPGAFWRSTRQPKMFWRPVIPPTPPNILPAVILPMALLTSCAAFAPS